MSLHLLCLLGHNFRICFYFDLVKLKLYFFNPELITCCSKNKGKTKIILGGAGI
jgi:hypothetical protein